MDKESSTIWIKNPMILVDADCAHEVFPIYNKGSRESMINSIGRLLMLLTILVLLFKRESLSILLMIFVGFVFLTISLSQTESMHSETNIHQDMEKSAEPEIISSCSGVSSSLSKILRSIKAYSDESANEPDYIDAKINRSTGAYKNMIASQNVTHDGLQYGVAFNRGKYIKSKRYMDNF